MVARRRQAGTPLDGVIRLQTAWMRMSMAAGEVIWRRSLLAAQGGLSASETSRMFLEKSTAATEAMERATRAAVGGASAVAVAQAALTPYGRHARANAKRLGR
jgi:ABC-type molybdate transport system substrate-binding protein